MPFNALSLHGPAALPATANAAAHAVNPRRVLVAALAAAAMIGGCGSGSGGNPPPTPGPGEPGAGLTSPGTTAAGAGPTGRTGGTQVAVPKDAKYTILCRAFTGPARVQQATVSKDNLVAATGRREFFVVHDESESTLYFGYYRERDRSIDAGDAARSLRDLEYVRSLVDGEQNRLFARSLVVPLPLAEPEAPREYDLAHLDQNKSPDDPTRRFWSVAIADYSGDATRDGKNRKQLAVEAVVEARKSGIEAYFYNGPTTSTVCVGAWPRTAIREQERAEARTTGDTGREIIVSNGPLPSGLRDRFAENGRDVEIFEPKVEIDDPSLRDTLVRYRAYSVNGEEQATIFTDPRTGERSRRPKKSFLFAIPQAAPVSSILAGTPQEEAPTPTVVNPLSPAGATGGGRLRSVTP